ncbi:MAG TPA: helix-turn-helix domain-containing protein [Burkholderiaceae bacterium]
MTALTLPRPGSTLLTDADRDLIRMLADGMTGKQIGRRLGVAPTVVSTRTARLRAKTGTDNTAHLVATATRCGWIGAWELHRIAAQHNAALRAIAQRAADGGAR